MLKGSDFNLLVILKNTERLYYRVSKDDIHSEAKDRLANSEYFLIKERAESGATLSDSYLTALRADLYCANIGLLCSSLEQNADGMYSISQIGDGELSNSPSVRPEYTRRMIDFKNKIIVSNSSNNKLDLTTMKIDKINTFIGTVPELCKAIISILKVLFNISVTDTPEAIQEAICSLYKFNTLEYKILNPFKLSLIDICTRWKRAYENNIFAGNKSKTSSEVAAETWYNKLESQFKILKYLSNNISNTGNVTYETDYNTRVILVNDSIYIYKTDDAGNITGKFVTNKCEFDSNDNLVIKNADFISNFTLDDYNNQSIKCSCGKVISSRNLLFGFKKVSPSQSFKDAIRLEKNNSFLYNEVKFFSNPNDSDGNTGFISDTLPSSSASVIQTYGALCSHNVVFCNECGKVHILPNLLIKFLQAFHSNTIFTLNSGINEKTSYPVSYGYKAEAIINKVLNRYNSYLLESPMIGPINKRLAELDSRIERTDKTNYNLFILRKEKSELEDKLKDILSKYYCVGNSSEETEKAETTSLFTAFKNIRDSASLYLSDLSEVEYNSGYSLFYSSLRFLGKTIGISDEDMSYKTILTQMFENNEPIWKCFCEISNICSQIRIGVDIYTKFSSLTLPHPVIYETQITEYDLQKLKENILEKFTKLKELSAKFGKVVSDIDFNSSTWGNDICSLCLDVKQYFKLNEPFQSLLYDKTIDVQFCPEFINSNFTDIDTSIYVDMLSFSDLTYLYILGLAAKICTCKNVIYLKEFSEMNYKEWDKCSQRNPLFMDKGNISLKFNSGVGRKLFNRLHYTIKLNFSSDRINEEKILNTQNDVGITIPKSVLSISPFPNIVNFNTRYNYSCIASFFGFSDITVELLNSEDRYTNSCEKILLKSKYNEHLDSEIQIKENIEFNLQSIIEVLKLYISMKGKFSATIEAGTKLLLDSYESWNKEGR